MFSDKLRPEDVEGCRVWTNLHCEYWHVHEGHKHVRPPCSCFIRPTGAANMVWVDVDAGWASPVWKTMCWQNTGLSVGGFVVIYNQRWDFVVKSLQCSFFFLTCELTGLSWLLIEGPGLEALWGDGVFVPIMGYRQIRFLPALISPTFLTSDAVQVWRRPGTFTGHRSLHHRQGIYDLCRGKCGFHKWLEKNNWSGRLGRQRVRFRILLTLISK